MSEAKLHHYVPRFLLRQFASPRGTVAVYDKKTEKTFDASVGRIAAETRFNEYQEDGETFSYESTLASIEGRACRVIEGLIASKNVARLGNDKRLPLAEFIAVQMVRTPASREYARTMRTILSDFILSGTRSEEERLAALAYIGPAPTPEEEKKYAIGRIEDARAAFTSILLERKWLLAEPSDSRDRFFISDNPVALQNLIERPGRGNLGIKSPGIEIYLPLGPRLLLQLLCPDLVETMCSLTEAYPHLRRPLSCGSRHRSARSSISGVIVAKNVIQAIQRGNVIALTRQNMENINSLQVRSAERFVFGSTKDFHLPREMVQEDPRLARGPRPAAR